MSKLTKPRRGAGMPSRAALDAYQARLKALIAEHGYIVQGVLSDPPFSYTVGLHQTHHRPELVMVGLDPATMHSVLNDVASGSC